MTLFFQRLGAKLHKSFWGISNPFKVKRQYKRYIGKQVRVSTIDGEQLECTLKKVDDTQIEVEYIETTKGKVISRKLFEIKFDTITILF